MRWKFTTSMSITRVETFRMAPKCVSFPEFEKLDSGLMLAIRELSKLFALSSKATFFSTHAYSVRRTDQWPAALNQKHWWTSRFWNSKTETRLFSLFYEETIPNTISCKGIPPKVLVLLCQEAMGFFVLEKSSNALTSIGTCEIPLWQSGDRNHT